VPMSEQATAGHGPDRLGLPIVIEGSPEARQTAAMLAISGTEAVLDRDAEQTGTPDTMVAHPTSSVYGAGAAGPALAQARDTTTKQDFTDPSLVPFSSFFTLNNILILKSGLEVTQCH